MGDSGPTLKPTDALAEARRRARARLATSHATIKTKNIAVTTNVEGQDTQTEVTLEQAEGSVKNSAIAAMWYDENGSGPENAAGCAYAVACPRGAGGGAVEAWPAESLQGRAGPRWVYDVPHETGRICAVGLSGPTLISADADANAEQSAREQLAAAIAFKAKTATAIFDNDEVLYGAVTEICDTCEESAAQGRITARWRDDRGEGPLPYPGTSYVLVCMES